MVAVQDAYSWFVCTAGVTIARLWHRYYLE